VTGNKSNIPGLLFSLTITGPADICLVVSELLSAAGYFPTVWTSPESAEGVVYLYCETQSDAYAARERMHALLDAVPDIVPPGSCSVRTGRLQKQEWTEYWKRFFHTERVGRHLVVKPQWEDYQSLPDDIILNIDPGMAFGTGQHDTTRACLELLEQIAGEASSSSFLDIGTGSGILSIAAAKLGFCPVDTFDNFPGAICIAKENCRINGVDGMVTLFTADLDDFTPQQQYDVVIANVLCDVLTRNAKTTVSCMKDTGTLILSGILTEQYHEIETAFTARGLIEIDHVISGEWKTGRYSFKHLP
jgi:ribosomal protein L11 methyltransferase